MAEVNWSLILDYIRALVWPVLIIGLVFAFRRPLRKWFERPPHTLELPGGVKLGWPEAQEWAVPPEADVDAAFEPYEDDAFVQALRNELREEVEQEVADDVRADLRPVIESLVSDQVRVRLELDFERIFNRIFGSQITLLENLRDQGPQTRAYFDAWFAPWKQTYAPNLPWTTDTYLHFLRTNGLIDENPPRTFVITQKGLAFLGYLQQVGYDKNWRAF